jgi:hypothetical protein
MQRLGYLFKFFIVSDMQLLKAVCRCLNWPIKLHNPYYRTQEMCLVW